MAKSPVWLIFLTKNSEIQVSKQVTSLIFCKTFGRPFLKNDKTVFSIYIYDKGQLTQNDFLESSIFQKNNAEIWWISALEFKKWLN